MLAGCLRTLALLARPRRDWRFISLLGSGSGVETEAFEAGLELGAGVPEDGGRLRFVPLGFGEGIQDQAFLHLGEGLSGQGARGLAPGVLSGRADGRPRRRIEIVISPKNAGSVVTKLTASTILRGGTRCTNRTLTMVQRAVSQGTAGSSLPQSSRRLSGADG